MPLDGTGSPANAESFSWLRPDGVSVCDGTPESPGQTVRFFSVDGSFLRLDITTDSDLDVNNNPWTLYAPDGSRIVNKPTSGVEQRHYDRNGNYIKL